MASVIARTILVLQKRNAYRLTCVPLINNKPYCQYVSLEKNHTHYNGCHEISSEHWKFVERLKPPSVVPSLPKLESYSSGWTPAPETPPNLPYFIKRTKNHMVPVYLNFEAVRNQRKITMIRQIEGDIWALNEDLKSHLETLRKVPIVSQVHEVGMYIKLRGDFVLHVKEWLLKTGF